MIKKELRPFTKWVGGKRQLIFELDSLLPKSFNTYYEPFIGGGAFFFHLLPKKAVINDLNSDLILSYLAIRDDLQNLLIELKNHDKNNSKEYFLYLRNYDRNGKLDSLSNTQKAARIMYMLRVCFNGMYRVNSKNQFNVPYGKYKNPKIVDEELLNNISEYLKTSDVHIMNTDFEIALKNCERGDLVYLDPPYVPVSKTSSFTSYTNLGFNDEEQLKLKNTFDNLTKKGVYCILSNSYSSLILDLYKDYKIHKVKANRNINSVGSKRGPITEIIITNY